MTDKWFTVMNTLEQRSVDKGYPVGHVLTYQFQYKVILSWGEAARAERREER